VYCVKISLNLARRSSAVNRSAFAIVFILFLLETLGRNFVADN
jgi:hypothetical protein